FGAQLNCDIPIYCSGPILEKIQLARLFNDSKTFVDMPTKKPLEEVLEAGSKLPQNASISILQDFVNSYFSKEGQELIQTEILNFNQSPSFLEKIKQPIIREFAKQVHNYWPNLTRKVDQSFMCSGCVSSFIPVNRSFVIPGGRFREIYYWDSYFVIEGLLVSELYEIAKNMIENFLDLIEIYGFVPNGSRIYYLNRSQPPLLTQMVKIYYEATNDILLLRKAFPTLLKEYDFWYKNNTISVHKNDKTFYLSHYDVYNIYPRPESYLEDYTTVELDSFNSTVKQGLYSDIATAAESGWDFSSRWARNPHIKPPTNSSSNNYEILRTLNTRAVIPIELNSILYMNEITLSEFAKQVDDWKTVKETVKRLKKSAEERLEGMIKLLWDDNTGTFRDYNLTSNTQSKIFSLATYFPFWAQSLPEEMLTDSKNNIKSFSIVSTLLSEYKGCPPVTLINSSLQWDFPNSWPPLTYAIIKGLLNSYHGYYSNSQNKEDPKFLNLALETSQRYVSSVMCAWYSTGGSIPGLLTKLQGTTDVGHMFEKYSALETGLPGNGGEYQVQDGFGWTNGVLLWIMSKFGDKLEVPE
ncbi:17646_t:CDS:2, partial [Cetraspora pellucida]